MRISILTCIASALTLQIAVADEVRRTKFAGGLLGAWAPGTEACASKDQPAITISEGGFRNADGNCDVLWIVEKATPRGTTYGVHARCVDPLDQKKSKVADLIIRADGNDRIALGKSEDELKTFQRCPAK